MATSEQVVVLLEELRANTERTTTLLKSNDETRLTTRPPKGGWSAVERIQHLTLTSELYLKFVPQVISEGKKENRLNNGPFTMDFKGRFLKWFLEPPYRMKSKTIPSADVHSAESPRKVLSDFLTTQERLAKMMNSADGLDMNNVFVTSLFSQKMKYNLYSLFAILAAHQRRHVWQAEQTLTSLV